MRAGSTIVALSSGALPAGVAVVRLSGPAVQSLLRRHCGGVPPARQMVLRDIGGRGDEVLDRGLVVFFPGPHSFTGEDCAELHVHGSRAVVAALLGELTRVGDVRLAEAGEFTRRAFENGKLDLTAVEGLGDLIAAETESQRKQALGRASGLLRHQVAGWREALTGLRAEIEAQLDFADEDDVPEGLDPAIGKRIGDLRASLQDALQATAGGRIVREGFRVVLAGAPNVGKSSLINALTQSDIAIVSREAGTTRDVREVPINVDGQMVLLIDVAGLRDTGSEAEAEGVRRARREVERAHLVLDLKAPDVADRPGITGGEGRTAVVGTKSDIGAVPGAELAVSAHDGTGLAGLLELIRGELATHVGPEPSLVSHRRDAEALESALKALSPSAIEGAPPELVAEALRTASTALARLTGEIDAEAVLDRLFAGFCIGK